MLLEPDFLDAHDKYIVQRRINRNRFRFNLDDVEEKPLEIIQTGESVITMCQMSQNRIVIASEQGHLNIIDCANLNKDLDYSSTRVATIQGYIWHAATLDNFRVVNMGRIYDSQSKTNMAYDPENQPLPVEYGRRAIHCYNGRYILSCSHSRVYVHDTLLAKTVELVNYNNAVRCLEPLEKHRLAIGGDMGEVIIYDFETGATIRRLKQDHNVWSLMDLGNDKLVVNEYGRTLILWNIGTGEQIHSLKVPDQIRTLTYLSDDYFLTTCDDGRMYIVDINKWSIVITLKIAPATDGRNDMLGAELLDDGRLATVSRDRTIQVWRFVNVATPGILFKRLRTCRAHQDCSVITV